MQSPRRQRSQGGKETDFHPVPRAWAEHALSPQNVLYSIELVFNGSGIIEKTLGRSMPEHKQ